MIPHLLELGITAVELMPIFQFDPDDGNYWGYMPLNFFSPHHAYATRPGERQQQHEFRSMVKSLHAAGIEVLLDVVFNHTCEGDHRGPTYSFKGIDSSSAYMITGDPESPYANYSGTGNTLHTANRAVRRHIVDSLRFWDSQMHVDGFRFDLASVFTRNSDGSINLSDPPIVSEIGTDADLSDNRLIAEPWDADGQFQLGQKFVEFSWNCGWEGDDALPGEVLTLRKRQIKNFFVLLMLSNGTPMFRMGDEFMHTQGGNNNPYNQDNETSWLDWRRLREHHDMFRFFKLMIAFRKSHRSISRSRFWRDDIKWYGAAQTSSHRMVRKSTARSFSNAVDAHCRVGHCFESLRRDGFSATRANSIGTLVDAVQC